MYEQAKKQGVFDERVEHLDRLHVGMADLSLKFNALAQFVDIYFVNASTDVYMDTTIEVVKVVRDKRAIVSKKNDMIYVQRLFETLLEGDTEENGWHIWLTGKGLPRHVQHDDIIKIAGILYSVSMVAPYNRLNDGLEHIWVYPERTLKEDELVYKDEGDCDCGKVMFKECCIRQGE